MLNNKKKLLVSGLILSFALIPFLSTSAQVPGTGLRQDIRGNREMMNKSRVKMLGDKSVLRLTAALNRADGFRQRAALHASQFPNPRFDRSVVDQKLKEAELAIASGRTAVNDLQSALDSALSESGTDGSFTEVRAKINEVLRSIRTAHQKVVEAIRLIKAAYPSTPTATSTNQ